MERNFSRLLHAGLLMVVLVCMACGNDPQSREGGGVCSLEIGISLEGGKNGGIASRSDVPNNPADLYDNRVSTLRILVFHHQSGELVQNWKTPVGDTENDPKITLSLFESVYDLVAVCNETAEVGVLLDAVKQRAELNALAVSSNAFTGTAAIPMVGEATSVNISQAGLTEVDGVKAFRYTVDVNRLATCLNLTVLTKLPENPSPTTILGKLTELQLIGLPESVGLMPGTVAAYKRTGTGVTRTLTDVDFTDVAIDVETDPDTGEAIPPVYGTKQTATRIIVPSWLFANPADVAQAVKVKATFTNKQQLEGVISYTLDGTKRYTLNRNARYALTLTGAPKGLELVLTNQILDWEDTNQSGGI